MTMLSKTLATSAALGIAVAATLFFMPASSVNSAQTSAPEVSAPPPLATDSTYMTNTVTTSVIGRVPEVRAFFDANPVTDFVAATDAIPAITGITYLSGDWPDVGALRRVELAGGHFVHERVLVNNPDRFAYQIWDITAPAGRFISHIMGEFQYIQNGETVEIVWDYNIKPSVFVARPFIQRFLINDFAPFMQAGMSGVVNAYQNQ